MRNFYKDKDLSAIVHTSLKTFTLQLCVCACSFLLSQQTAPSLSFSRLEETEIDVIWNSVRKKKNWTRVKLLTLHRWIHVFASLWETSLWETTRSDPHPTRTTAPYTQVWLPERKGGAKQLGTRSETDGKYEPKRWCKTQTVVIGWQFSRNDLKHAWEFGKGLCNSIWPAATTHTRTQTEEDMFRGHSSQCNDFAAPRCFLNGAIFAH